MKILEGLDTVAFIEAFLSAHLQDGFAAVSKLEIYLVVLRLLVDHKEGWSWKSPPNAFEMARALMANSSGEVAV